MAGAATISPQPPTMAMSTSAAENPQAPSDGEPGARETVKHRAAVSTSRVHRSDHRWRTAAGRPPTSPFKPAGVMIPEEEPGGNAARMSAVDAPATLTWVSGRGARALRSTAPRTRSSPGRLERDDVGRRLEEPGRDSGPHANQQSPFPSSARAFAQPAARIKAERSRPCAWAPALAPGRCRWRRERKSALAGSTEEVNPESGAGPPATSRS
jgi:hypothetical protein